MAAQWDVADKVAKLLNKAESTGFQAERDALLEKAQELMARYCIDEAMLAMKKPVEREEIVEAERYYDGIYCKSKMRLGHRVALYNQVNSFYTVTKATSSGQPKQIRLTYVGFQSDVDRAVMLDSSLQVQAAMALNEYWKLPETKAQMEWMTNGQKTQARHHFLDGFAEGVADKLYKANVEAKKAATINLAKEEDLTDEDASQQVGLALRSRKDTVDEWVDRKYGKMRAGRTRYSSSSYGSRNAGRVAGARANTGEKAFGQRGALNG